MQVTLKEVFMIVNDLPNGKSSGFDGLNSKSLKHFSVLITVNLFYLYVYTLLFINMPSSMINFIIVVLAKNKCGNLADKNNYRAIALSNISSKVFEHVILFRFEDYLWTNDNQFGFKPSHSTDLYVYVFFSLVLLL